MHPHPRGPNLLTGPVGSPTCCSLPAVFGSRFHMPPYSTAVPPARAHFYEFPKLPHSELPIYTHSLLQVLVQQNSLSFALENKLELRAITFPFFSPKKMVSGFRRSASMPKPTRSAPEKSYHIRSTSLPARSHPLLSQLKDRIETLWSWVSDQSGPSSARICDGLNRLRSVHDEVNDLLHLAQSQYLIRRQPELVDELLDRFLRFADAFGILRSGMVGLNESVRLVQVETRAGRQDPVRSYVRSLKKLAKEVSPAVSMVRESEKKARPDVSTSVEEDEVVETLREACSVTAAVLEAVFISVSWCNSSNWIGLIRRKKRGEGMMMMRELEEAAEMGLSEEKAVALRRLQAAEECVEGIERESERLYRSLICTRVSLLNVMTTR